ncbi:Peroxisome chaperone and import receptor [Gnomoniopsis smithogilvyi]|uniref:Peroxisome chaperone and import receptor n=1 Tax=Gnomoniopsis smithogilvyi TaxID=1191159 RepID=A0A9W8YZM6_9PEZI|nr:Peroxisome chaperone and import receptor [Gnomoniopsis smithogilvyi]
MASQPEATKPESSATEQLDLDDVGDVPDPDEDDLDDLDDMLDDFKAAMIDSSKPAVASSASADLPKDVHSPPTADPTTAKAAEEEVLSDDDFAKQLQAGMAELMGEIENSPEMAAQFENIFKELGAAAAAGATPPSSSSAAAPGASRDADSAASASTGPGGVDFQETIRRTMERMQASGESATAAATAEGSDDFMAEMLRQMGGEGGLEGSEEDFSKMLLGMMEQLTNKDILYEPMKELNDKFPEWMEKNKDTISQEDRERYEVQESLVKEIVGKFEESTYSDSNTADREYIVERMQKMQAAGSPPPDLVGDMPSAQDAMGGPDMESCNPQ